LLLDRVSPGVEMGGKIGVAAIDRLADEIEWNRLPRHIRFRIDAGLRQRDLEGDLRRRTNAVSRNRLAFDAGEILHARCLGGEQTLAPAMRADEEFHIEALLQGLQ